MIGWLIVGGVALWALQQKSAVPQPGGALITKPVAMMGIPAVLSHGPVVQSFAGNEPVLPGKPVAPQFILPASVPGVNFNPRILPSPTLTKLADAQAGASVAANLQIAVATNKAGGMYTGYGVPLSGPGMFAPLSTSVDPSTGLSTGTFDTSSLGIDNGTTWGPVSLAGSSFGLDSGGVSGYGL